MNEPTLAAGNLKTRRWAAVELLLGWEDTIEKRGFDIEVVSAESQFVGDGEQRADRS